MTPAIRDTWGFLMSDSNDRVAKANERSRRIDQRDLYWTFTMAEKLFSIMAKREKPSNPPEAVVSNNRKEGGIDWNPPSEDRADRIEWSKFSTGDMDDFLRPMRPDQVKLMFMELMGPVEKREFIGGLERLAKDKIQERAEINKLMKEVDSHTRLAGDLGRLQEARVALGIPWRVRETSEGQNVAPVTPDVTLVPPDVTLSVTDVTQRSSQKSHDVTVVASEVTPVTPASVVVRAKRGEDGLYHCRECDYVADRAGTLRMHRFRKHPKNRM